MMKNQLAGLMQQAQKMQEQLAQTQAGLAEKTVEITAGGGKITAGHSERDDGARHILTIGR